MEEPEQIKGMLQAFAAEHRRDQYHSPPLKSIHVLKHE